MNSNCEHIKDRLVECISEHIELNETLVEHLRQCSECSKYYEGLKADDQVLSNFANSMQPILARIENNVSKELEKEKVRSILSPQNRIIRLAAAAVILIAVTLTLNKLGIVFDGTSAAWAKVSDIILAIRTTTFDAVIGNGPVVSCTASERKLKQKLPSGVEAVFDYDRSKILVLNPNDKTAMTVELSSLPIMPANILENLKSTIEVLKKCPDTIIKSLGKKEINNEEAAGIHIYLDKSVDVEIWYKAKDNMPVLILAKNMMGQTKVVFSNFKFDVMVDDSVFNLAVPEGYTETKSATMDFKNLSEQDLIEGLGQWAILMGNKFPEKLDLSILQEYSKTIEQKLNEEGKSDVEKAIIAIKIIRALMFTQQIQSNWHYNGSGLQLGDKNAAIFWYMPTGAKIYRVLFGDLHIADVNSVKLPGAP